jgi:hypothetical protein
MKDYKEKKEPKASKPAKLHQCGHVERVLGVGYADYVKCDVLTSKKITLDNGQRIYVCETHRRLHEDK